MLTRFNADAAALLARIPESWALFDRKGFSEREDSALRLLLEFRLIELQQTVRMQLLGDARAVDADIQTTGVPTHEHLFAQMQPLLARYWGSELTEDRYTQYRIGVERWRLTHEGTVALEHWKSRRGPTEYDAVLFNEPMVAVPGCDAIMDLRKVALTGEPVTDDDDAIKLEAAVQSLKVAISKLGRTASRAELKKACPMNATLFGRAIKYLRDHNELEGGTPGRRTRKN